MNGYMIAGNVESETAQDLNDLIALKMGCTIKEAFDLNREKLALGEWYNLMKANIPIVSEKKGLMFVEPDSKQKHNSLWDAKVIKINYGILNKIKNPA